MIEKIKKFIVGQAVKYGLIVTYLLLAELLNIFHPSDETIKLFLTSTLVDIWITVFFTFLDAFRNRNVSPKDYKKTPNIVKYGCFHISALVRFIFLLVALNYFDARQLMEKFSVALFVSAFGGLMFYFLTLGYSCLVAPTPGGKKAKIFFKIIQNGAFLVMFVFVLSVSILFLTEFTKNNTESNIPSETSPLPTVEIPLESNGIFIGTANRNDFYLLPETFSSDEKNFKVIVEYVDKDENQKGTLGYFFIYNPVGWIYYDTIDESRKNYVSKLKEGDVVKNIWQYCYENLVVKSPTPSEQSESPKKKPMYRYPSQHNNGTYVWAGYMKSFGCYLDTNSIHVFDNTSNYKDWEQVVKIYDEDNFVNSVTQNFHWDPQNGPCVGGRGISKITDRNLMYQFETGWQYAFGSRYNQ